MSKLKLEIDYKRKEEEVKQISNVALSTDYIHYAVNQTYQKGLKGQMLRVWGRIQRKLDEAMDKNLPDIEVEQAELDFIKEAVDKTEFPAGISKFVMVFQDEAFKTE
jgi:energy-converting hydrogenase A subunit M